MIQLLLTFVPVYTLLATIAAAAAATGRARWLALAVVPLAGTGLSWTALPIAGENGNMLAVALVLLLSADLVPYHPGLLVAAVVARTRRRRSETDGRAGPPTRARASNDNSP